MQSLLPLVDGVYMHRTYPWVIMCVIVVEYNPRRLHTEFALFLFYYGKVTAAFDKLASLSISQSCDCHIANEVTLTSEG